MARHEGAEGFFSILSDAIARKRLCRIEYDSFYEGKIIKVSVHPLRQVFVQRAWYLLAWSVSQRAIRTYKLVRIRSLDVTIRSFSANHTKQLDAHFGRAWAMIPEGKIYNVHLHFEPKVAGNVAEVQWHKTQRVEWNADKSIEYHVQVDGLGEISWWILGYGDQVRVVSPKPLQKRIRQVARAVLKKYGQER
jgi:proteasome accessory factor B